MRRESGPARAGRYSCTMLHGTGREHDSRDNWGAAEPRLLVYTVLAHRARRGRARRLVAPGLVCRSQRERTRRACQTTPPFADLRLRVSTEEPERSAIAGKWLAAPHRDSARDDVRLRPRMRADHRRLLHLLDHLERLELLRRRRSAASIGGEAFAATAVGCGAR